MAKAHGGRVGVERGRRRDAGMAMGDGWQRVEGVMGSVRCGGATVVHSRSLLLCGPGGSCLHVKGLSRSIGAASHRRGRKRGGGHGAVGMAVGARVRVRVCREGGRSNVDSGRRADSRR
jgi:hypothetical protein